ALCQSGSNRDAGRQHQSRNAIAAEPLCFRCLSQKWVWATMRYEAAHEISPARRSGIDGSPLNIGTARVGMNQRQHGLGLRDPAGVRARQVRSGVFGYGENPEVVL